MSYTIEISRSYKNLGQPIFADALMINNFLNINSPEERDYYFSQFVGCNCRLSLSTEIKLKNESTIIQTKTVARIVDGVLQYLNAPAVGQPSKSVVAGTTLLKLIDNIPTAVDAATSLDFVYDSLTIFDETQKSLNDVIVLRSACNLTLDPYVVGKNLPVGALIVCEVVPGNMAEKIDLPNNVNPKSLLGKAGAVYSWAT
ncbi:MAG: hypothetical protein LBD98_03205 [Endomicrobium sp.]|jgi:hypothetical protein|nr:hypothetical protein [Endomicrobium sp.]